jgi:hypothetical protein
LPCKLQPFHVEKAFEPFEVARATGCLASFNRSLACWLSTKLVPWAPQVERWG